MLLQQDDADTQHVTPEHTLSDDEHGEPEESMTDGLVTGTKCFQDTDHLRALQNDD